jgi:hypothetical protein
VGLGVGEIFGGGVGVGVFTRGCNAVCVVAAVAADSHQIETMKTAERQAFFLIRSILQKSRDRG